MHQADVADPPGSMFPPELSILRHNVPRPGEGAVPGRSSLPFPFPPPVDSLPSPNNRPWEHTDPEDNQDALNIRHSVQCEDNKMVVSIEKEILKVSKIVYSHYFIMDGNGEMGDV